MRQPNMDYKYSDPRVEQIQQSSQAEQPCQDEYITTLKGTDYDPRVEQTQQPCQANKAESITTLKGSDYDPRDQIIANLSIENEILRKRLKEIHQASADIRDALDAARDKFARLREYNYY